MCERRWNLKHEEGLAETGACRVYPVTGEKAEYVGMDVDGRVGVL